MNPTDKELEALLLTAAKVTGGGAVGVDPDRARDWGVPIGVLTQAGTLIAGSQTKAEQTGYYCPRSNPLGIPDFCLLTDIDDHGDGRAHRYRLVVLHEGHTGHYSLDGGLESYTRSEYAAYLRGVIAHARSRNP